MSFLFQVYRDDLPTVHIFKIHDITLTAVHQLSRSGCINGLSSAQVGFCLVGLTVGNEQNLSAAMICSIFWFLYNVVVRSFSQAFVSKVGIEKVRNFQHTFHLTLNIQNFTLSFIRLFFPNFCWKKIKNDRRFSYKYLIGRYL